MLRRGEKAGPSMCEEQVVLSVCHLNLRHWLEEERNFSYNLQPKAPLSPETRHRNS